MAINYKLQIAFIATIIIVIVGLPLYIYVFQNAKSNWFSIEYDDVSDFWGGTDIIVYSNGQITEKDIKPGDQSLSEKKGVLLPIEINELNKLILKYKVWEQIAPERQADPDETKAFLKINYGNKNSSIWEWYNDLNKNQRIIIIKNFLESKLNSVQ